MSLGPLYVFLGEVSVQVLCPFFNWVVCFPGVESCEFFIYLGDQILVWGIIDKYVFPYSQFPFNFADVCFSCAEVFFILMRFHLFTLSFISLTLEDIVVQILLDGISEIFLPIFSSKTFMVSWLIFKSFIHPEFIFVYGVSWWSNFIFLHVSVQISQHHLLKRLFLLHFMLLLPLSKINWP